MSTRSTIAMRYPDGHVKAVYAHWDGYPSHNGKILLEHYSNPWLLDCLLHLGAISILMPKIGRQHPFDYKFDPSLETTVEQKAKWDTWTMAYHRDRGEELRIMEFATFWEYRRELPTEEFNYLYLPTSGWEYTKGDNKHRFGLRETLAELEKHRDED